MSGAHKNSVILWSSFKQAESHSSVVDQLTNQRALTVASNRKYITFLGKVAVFCARQCIALRGHDETSGSANKGNFVELVDLIKSTSPQFDFQCKSLPKNAKYTSKSVQNDLLKAAADVVLR